MAPNPSLQRAPCLVIRDGHTSKGVWSRKTLLGRGSVRFIYKSIPMPNPDTGKTVRVISISTGLCIVLVFVLFVLLSKPSQSTQINETGYSASTTVETSNESREVLTYMVTCNQDVSTITDCTNLVPGYTTVHNKADVINQTVYISSVPSRNPKLTDYTYHSYEVADNDCSVANASTYTCHHSNGFVDGLSNGVPFPFSTKMPATSYTAGMTTFQFSETDWLQLPLAFRQP
jgi:hypothetical protein